MSKPFLALAFAFMMGAPVQAATDWTAAAEAWRGQYRDLVIAEAAGEHCEIKVAKPIRKAMKEAREGLRDALAAFGAPEKPRAIVAALGGKKALCANAGAMETAKATIAKFGADRMESGNNTTLPLAAPHAGAPIAANAPTPVIDPNIALIRNCRQAALTKLGKKSTDNERFWSTYEGCMKDQGVGWF